MPYRRSSEEKFFSDAECVECDHPLEHHAADRKCPGERGYIPPARWALFRFADNFGRFQFWQLQVATALMAVGMVAVVTRLSFVGGVALDAMRSMASRTKAAAHSFCAEPILDAGTQVLRPPLDFYIPPESRPVFAPTYPPETKAAGASGALEFDLLDAGPLRFAMVASSRVLIESVDSFSERPASVEIFDYDNNARGPLISLFGVGHVADGGHFTERHPDGGPALRAVVACGVDLQVERERCAP